MKVVHDNVKKAKEDLSLLERAQSLEKEGSADAAATYEKVIKAQPHNETAYDRLLIIYRKNKAFKKELAVLNAGIKAFEELYRDKVKRNPSSKMVKISKALLKLTGLSDKKGQPLYQREPIGKWTRRKQLLLAKIKKANKS